MAHPKFAVSWNGMNMKGIDRTGLVPMILSWMAMLLGAIDPALAMPHSSLIVAQVTTTTPTAETGCRQVNASTGIYTQPSLDSSSRGILANGQTVRLELIGSGSGWARITDPMIGWVEAKYLSPISACGAATSPTSTGYTAIAQTATPTATATATPTAAQIAQSIAAVCEVLPTEGLVVRSEPLIAGNTALHTIPKGAHQFQFTNNYLTTQSGSLERYWVYITAPYQGWISLGATGENFNLGGRECG